MIALSSKWYLVPALVVSLVMSGVGWWRAGELQAERDELQENLDLKRAMVDVAITALENGNANARTYLDSFSSCVEKLRQCREGGGW